MDCDEDVDFDAQVDTEECCFDLPPEEQYEESLQEPFAEGDQIPCLPCSETPAIDEPSTSSAFLESHFLFLFWFLFEY